MSAASFIAAVVLAAASPASPDVDQAISEARVHAGAGDYEKALATIRSAREKQDEPDLIFVEAQLLRISGDCNQALVRYDEFLATNPPDQDSAEVEQYIEACEAQVGPRPAPVVPPPEAVVEPEVVAPEPVTAEPAPVEPVPQPGPNQHDRLGLGLWISGGVVLAAGAGTYGASWALRGRADRGDPTLDDYLDRERRARTVAGVGIATMSVGASILIAAAIRHVVLKKKRREAGVLSSIGWFRSPWR